MEYQESLALSAANYETHVGLKFQLYNILFLTLLLDGIKSTSIFIPVLYEYFVSRLADGQSPRDIINLFFEENRDSDN